MIQRSAAALLALSLALMTGFPVAAQNRALLKTISQSLNIAVQQYEAMDRALPDSLLPRTSAPEGKLITCKPGWWTSGFFSGSLWYLYQFSDKPLLKELATKRMELLRSQQYNDHDHDIGFKMNCSFGNALRLTGNAEYKEVLIQSARSLIKRFNPTVGTIRSWGDKDDQSNFLVIIDNMMNLELLFNATRLSGDSLFYRVAVAHANTTLKNHFRPDGSSFHVLEYDPATGAVTKKRTQQGFADSSAWARGQAWALYGFTMSIAKPAIRNTCSRLIASHSFCWKTRICRPIKFLTGILMQPIFPTPNAMHRLAPLWLRHYWN